MIKRSGWWLVVLTGAMTACSFGSYSGDVPDGPSPGGSPGNNIGDAGPIAAPTDLPCDVANFLVADCLLCHGPVPKNGAPNRLDTLDALKAPAYTQPSKSNGALALERIQSASSPMPPTPYAPATSAQISSFASWINAGMPAGSCAAPPPDAGPPPLGDAGLPPTDGGVSNDLPCGVAGTLGTYCTGCHGSPPTNGAPISLDSLAALRAVSSAYPGQTEGQRSVARMNSSTSPMPPAPYAAVPAAALNEFSAWVSSNMPAGSCTAPVDAGPPPVVDAGVDAGSSDAGVAGDLPCDVADVLTSSCTSCHGTPATGGAPMSLTSLAQLRASSPSNAAVTNGQACVQRMASTTAPMPPSPATPVTAAKQNAFSAWVSAGMPAGSCGVDAGMPDPAFSGPDTCTSGVYWTGGNGSSMRPGEACNRCHNWAVAGSAYPTGHEYNDCRGQAAQGATVTVTDKNNVSRTFTVNSAGNFSGSRSTGWPVFPIRAKITFNGKTRAMSGAVNSGDCNSCHTLRGTSGAPGRIALP